MYNKVIMDTIKEYHLLDKPYGCWKIPSSAILMMPEKMPLSFDRLHNGNITLNSFFYFNQHQEKKGFKKPLKINRLSWSCRWAKHASVDCFIYLYYWWYFIQSMLQKPVQIGACLAKNHWHCHNILCSYVRLVIERRLR